MTKTSTATEPKVSHKKKTPKTSKSKKSNALAICPINGAGWCPYPFSVKQLERKLRAKLAAKQNDE